MDDDPENAECTGCRETDKWVHDQFQRRQTEDGTDPDSSYLGLKLSDVDYLYDEDVPDSYQALHRGRVIDYAPCLASCKDCNSYFPGPSGATIASEAKEYKHYCDRLRITDHHYFWRNPLGKIFPPKDNFYNDAALVQLFRPCRLRYFPSRFMSKDEQCRFLLNKYNSAYQQYIPFAAYTAVWYKQASQYHINPIPEILWAAHMQGFHILGFWRFLKLPENEHDEYTLENISTGSCFTVTLGGFSKLNIVKRQQFFYESCSCMYICDARIKSQAKAKQAKMGIKRPRPPKQPNCIIYAPKDPESTRENPADCDCLEDFTPNVLPEPCTSFLKRNESTPRFPASIARSSPSPMTSRPRFPSTTHSAASSPRAMVTQVKSEEMDGRASVLSRIPQSKVEKDAARLSRKVNDEISRHQLQPVSQYVLPSGKVIPVFDSNQLRDHAEDEGDSSRRQRDTTPMLQERSAPPPGFVPVKLSPPATPKPPTTTETTPTVESVRPSTSGLQQHEQLQARAPPANSQTIDGRPALTQRNVLVRKVPFTQQQLEMAKPRTIVKKVIMKSSTANLESSTVQPHAIAKQLANAVWTTTAVLNTTASLSVSQPSTSSETSVVKSLGDLSISTKSEKSETESVPQKPPTSDSGNLPDAKKAEVAANPSTSTAPAGMKKQLITRKIRKPDGTIKVVRVIRLVSNSTTTTPSTSSRVRQPPATISKLTKDELERIFLEQITLAMVEDHEMLNDPNYYQDLFRPRESRLTPLSDDVKVQIVEMIKTTLDQMAKEEKEKQKVEKEKEQKEMLEEVARRIRQQIQNRKDYLELMSRPILSRETVSSDDSGCSSDESEPSAAALRMLDKASQINAAQAQVSQESGKSKKRAPKTMTRQVDDGFNYGDEAINEFQLLEISTIYNPTLFLKLLAQDRDVLKLHTRTVDCVPEEEARAYFAIPFLKRPLPIRIALWRLIWRKHNKNDPILPFDVQNVLGLKDDETITLQRWMFYMKAEVMTWNKEEAFYTHDGWNVFMTAVRNHYLLENFEDPDAPRLPWLTTLRSLRYMDEDAILRKASVPWPLEMMHIEEQNAQIKREQELEKKRKKDDINAVENMPPRKPRTRTRNNPDAPLTEALLEKPKGRPRGYYASHPVTDEQKAAREREKMAALEHTRDKRAQSESKRGRGRPPKKPRGRASLLYKERQAQLLSKQYGKKPASGIPTKALYRSKSLDQLSKPDGPSPIEWQWQKRRCRTPDPYRSHEHENLDMQLPTLSDVQRLLGQEARKEEHRIIRVEPDEARPPTPPPMAKLEDWQEETLQEEINRLIEIGYSRNPHRSELFGTLFATFNKDRQAWAKFRDAKRLKKPVGSAYSSFMDEHEDVFVSWIAYIRKLLAKELCLRRKEWQEFHDGKYYVDHGYTKTKHHYELYQWRKHYKSRAPYRPPKPVTRVEIDYDSEEEREEAERQRKIVEKKLAEDVEHVLLTAVDKIVIAERVEVERKSRQVVELLSEDLLKSTLAKSVIARFLFSTLLESEFIDEAQGQLFDSSKKDIEESLYISALLDRIVEETVESERHEVKLMLSASIMVEICDDELRSLLEQEIEKTQQEEAITAVATKLVLDTRAQINTIDRLHEHIVGDIVDDIIAEEVSSRAAEEATAELLLEKEQELFIENAADDLCEDMLMDYIADVIATSHTATFASHMIMRELSEVLHSRLLGCFLDTAADELIADVSFDMVEDVQQTEQIAHDVENIVEDVIGNAVQADEERHIQESKEKISADLANTLLCDTTNKLILRESERAVVTYRVSETIQRAVLTQTTEDFMSQLVSRELAINWISSLLSTSVVDELIIHYASTEMECVERERAAIGEIVDCIYVNFIDELQLEVCETAEREAATLEVVTNTIDVIIEKEDQEIAETAQIIMNDVVSRVEKKEISEELFNEEYTELLYRVDDVLLEMIWTHEIEQTTAQVVHGLVNRVEFLEIREHVLKMMWNQAETMVDMLARKTITEELEAIEREEETAAVVEQLVQTTVIQHFHHKAVGKLGNFIAEGLDNFTWRLLHEECVEEAAKRCSAAVVEDLVDSIVFEEKRQIIISTLYNEIEFDLEAYVYGVAFNMHKDIDAEFTANDVTTELVNQVVFEDQCRKEVDAMKSTFRDNGAKLLEEILSETIRREKEDFEIEEQAKAVVYSIVDNVDAQIRNEVHHVVLAELSTFVEGAFDAFTWAISSDAHEENEVKICARNIIARVERKENVEMIAANMMNFSDHFISSTLYDIIAQEQNDAEIEHSVKITANQLLDGIVLLEREEIRNEGYADVNKTIRKCAKNITKQQINRGLKALIKAQRKTIASAVEEREKSSSILASQIKNLQTHDDSALVGHHTTTDEEQNIDDDFFQQLQYSLLDDTPTTSAQYDTSQATVQEASHESSNPLGDLAEFFIIPAADKAASSSSTSESVHMIFETPKSKPFSKEDRYSMIREQIVLGRKLAKQANTQRLLKDSKGQESGAQKLHVLNPTEKSQLKIYYHSAIAEFPDSLFAKEYLQFAEGLQSILPQSDLEAGSSDFSASLELALSSATVLMSPGEAKRNSLCQREAASRLETLFGSGLGAYFERVSSSMRDRSVRISSDGLLAIYAADRFRAAAIGITVTINREEHDNLYYANLRSESEQAAISEAIREVKRRFADDSIWLPCVRSFKDKNQESMEHKKVHDKTTSNVAETPIDRPPLPKLIVRRKTQEENPARRNGREARSRNAKSQNVEKRRSKDTYEIVNQPVSLKPDTEDMKPGPSSIAESVGRQKPTEKVGTRAARVKPPLKLVIAKTWKVPSANVQQKDAKKIAKTAYSPQVRPDVMPPKKPPGRQRPQPPPVPKSLAMSKKIQPVPQHLEVPPCQTSSKFNEIPVHPIYAPETPKAKPEPIPVPQTQVPEPQFNCMDALEELDALDLQPLFQIEPSPPPPRPINDSPHSHSEEPLEFLEGEPPLEEIMMKATASSVRHPPAAPPVAKICSMETTLLDSMHVAPVYPQKLTVPPPQPGPLPDMLHIHQAVSEAVPQYVDMNAPSVMPLPDLGRSQYYGMQKSHPEEPHSQISQMLAAPRLSCQPVSAPTIQHPYMPSPYQHDPSTSMALPHFATLMQPRMGTTQVPSTGMQQMHFAHRQPEMEMYQHLPTTPQMHHNPYVDPQQTYAFQQFKVPNLEMPIKTQDLTELLNSQAMIPTPPMMMSTTPEPSPSPIGPSPKKLTPRGRGRGKKELMIENPQNTSPTSTTHMTPIQLRQVEMSRMLQHQMQQRHQATNPAVPAFNSRTMGVAQQQMISPPTRQTPIAPQLTHQNVAKSRHGAERPTAAPPYNAEMMAQSRRQRPNYPPQYPTLGDGYQQQEASGKVRIENSSAPRNYIAHYPSHPVIGHDQRQAAQGTSQQQHQSLPARNQHQQRHQTLQAPVQQQQQQPQQQPQQSVQQEKPQKLPGMMLFSHNQPSNSEFSSLQPTSKSDTTLDVNQQQMNFNYYRPQDMSMPNQQQYMNRQFHQYPMAGTSQIQGNQQYQMGGTQQNQQQFQSGHGGQTDPSQQQRQQQLPQQQQQSSMHGSSQNQQNQQQYPTQGTSHNQQQYNLPVSSQSHQYQMPASSQEHQIHQQYLNMPRSESTHQPMGQESNQQVMGEDHNYHYPMMGQYPANQMMMHENQQNAGMGYMHNQGMMGDLSMDAQYGMYNFQPYDSFPMHGMHNTDAGGGMPPGNETTPSFHNTQNSSNQNENFEYGHKREGHQQFFRLAQRILPPDQKQNDEERFVAGNNFVCLYEIDKGIVDKSLLNQSLRASRKFFQILKLYELLSNKLAERAVKTPAKWLNLEAKEQSTSYDHSANKLPLDRPGTSNNKKLPTDGANLNEELRKRIPLLNITNESLEPLSREINDIKLALLESGFTANIDVKVIKIGFDALDVAMNINIEQSLRNARAAGSAGLKKKRTAKSGQQTLTPEKLDNKSRDILKESAPTELPPISICVDGSGIAENAEDESVLKKLNSILSKFPSYFGRSVLFSDEALAMMLTTNSHVVDHQKIDIIAAPIKSSKKVKAEKSPLTLLRRSSAREEEIQIAEVKQPQDVRSEEGAERESPEVVQDSIAPPRLHPVETLLVSRSNAQVIRGAELCSVPATVSLPTLAEGSLDLRCRKRPNTSPSQHERKRKVPSSPTAVTPIVVAAARIQHFKKPRKPHVPFTMATLEAIQSLARKEIFIREKIIWSANAVAPLTCEAEPTGNLCIVKAEIKGRSGVLAHHLFCIQEIKVCAGSAELEFVLTGPTSTPAAQQLLNQVLPVFNHIPNLIAHMTRANSSNVIRGQFRATTTTTTTSTRQAEQSFSSGVYSQNNRSIANGRGVFSTHTNNGRVSNANSSSRPKVNFKRHALKSILGDFEGSRLPHTKIIAYAYRHSRYTHMALHCRISRPNMPTDQPFRTLKIYEAMESNMAAVTSKIDSILATLLINQEQSADVLLEAHLAYTQMIRAVWEYCCRIAQMSLLSPVTTILWCNDQNKVAERIANVHDGLMASATEFFKEDPMETIRKTHEEIKHLSPKKAFKARAAASHTLLSNIHIPTKLVETVDEIPIWDYTERVNIESSRKMCRPFNLMNEHGCQDRAFFYESVNLESRNFERVVRALLECHPLAATVHTDAAMAALSSGKSTQFTETVAMYKNFPIATSGIIRDLIHDFKLSGFIEPKELDHMRLYVGSPMSSIFAIAQYISNRNRLQMMTASGHANEAIKKVNALYLFTKKFENVGDSARTQLVFNLNLRAFGPSLNTVKRILYVEPTPPSLPLPQVEMTPLIMPQLPVLPFENQAPLPPLSQPLPNFNILDQNCLPLISQLLSMPPLQTIDPTFSIAGSYDSGIGSIPSTSTSLPGLHADSNSFSQYHPAPSTTSDSSLTSDASLQSLISSANSLALIEQLARIAPLHPDLLQMTLNSLLQPLTILPDQHMNYAPNMMSPNSLNLSMPPLPELEIPEPMERSRPLKRRMDCEVEQNAKRIHRETSIESAHEPLHILADAAESRASSIERLSPMDEKRSLLPKKHVEVHNFYIGLERLVCKLDYDSAELSIDRQVSHPRLKKSARPASNTIEYQLLRIISINNSLQSVKVQAIIEDGTINWEKTADRAQELASASPSSRILPCDVSVDSGDWSNPSSAYGSPRWDHRSSAEPDIENPQKPSPASAKVKVSTSSEIPSSRRPSRSYRKRALSVDPHLHRHLRHRRSSSVEEQGRNRCILARQLDPPMLPICELPFLGDAAYVRHKEEMTLFTRHPSVRQNLPAYLGRR